MARLASPNLQAVTQVVQMSVYHAEAIVTTLQECFFHYTKACLVTPTAGLLPVFQCYTTLYILFLVYRYVAAYICPVLQQLWIAYIISRLGKK